MTTSSSVSAIDLRTGALNVDTFGRSQYTYPIEVTGSIGIGNAPTLAFQYQQGSPNGPLGHGWSMNGFSVIQRSVLNEQQMSYSADTISRDKCISLDGQTLICIQGTYGTSDANYRTEIDSQRTVTGDPEHGFVVIDDYGRRIEFGTTSDTRVMAADSSTINMWLEYRSIDLHGNYVEYSYRRNGSDNGGNPCIYPCLETVKWTGNLRSNFAAPYLLQFTYEQRPDVLTTTSVGGFVAMAERLSSVAFTMNMNGTTTRIRTYQLKWTVSPNSDHSRIESIKVIGADNTTEAPPVTFNYSGNVIATGSAVQRYETEAPNHKLFFDKSNLNGQVLPIDISGRCITDLAIIQQNPVGQDVVVTTYLAQETDRKIGNRSVFDWSRSTGQGSTAKLGLKNVELRSGNIVLSADITGDGRADLIVAFDRTDKFHLSLAKSTGAGFSDAIPINTGLPSIARSLFVTMDIRGRGKLSLVQGYAENKHFNLRVFENLDDILLNGKIDPNNIHTASSNHVFGVNLALQPVNLSTRGIPGVVRVWWGPADPTDSRPVIKRNILRATTFRTPSYPYLQGDTFTVVEQMTELLKFDYTNEVERAVIHPFIVDFNQDGVQDILICRTESKTVNGTQRQTQFHFQSFLADGKGGFIPKAVSTVATISAEISNGSFRVAKWKGAQGPVICYLFTDNNANRMTGGFFPFDQFGQLQSSFVVTDIAGNGALTDSYISVLSADIGGHNLNDWLILSSQKRQSTTSWGISTIYDQSSFADLLNVVREPQGLETQIGYEVLNAIHGVYNPNETSSNPYSDSKDLLTSAPVIAAAGYVVNSVTTSPISSQNLFPSTSKTTYTYANARISLEGRGWLGFASVTQTEDATDVVSNMIIDRYRQDWPFVGVAYQTEKYDAQKTKFAQQETKYESVFYTSPVLPNARQSQVRRVEKMTERQLGYDGEPAGVLRAQILYKYDVNGNCLQEIYDAGESTGLGLSTMTQYTYRTINLIANYLESKTTSPCDRAGTVYVPKDPPSTHMSYKYDSNGLLTTESTFVSGIWRDVTKEYDIYGNITKTTEFSGTRIVETTFDPWTHSYPIVEVTKNTGLADYKINRAYDCRFGKIAATWIDEVITEVEEVDVFGRVTARKAVLSDNNESGKPFDAKQKKSEWLYDSKVEQFSSYNLVLMDETIREASQVNGISVPSKSIWTWYEEPWAEYPYSGRKTNKTFYDSYGNPRVSSLLYGKDFQKLSWTYSTMNKYHQQIGQSMPIFEQDENKALQTPAADHLWTKDQYDVLGRPISHTLPASDSTNPSIRLVTTFTYTDGGKKKVKILGAGTSDPQESSSTYTYVGNNLVISKTDDSFGRTMRHTYDDLARLTKVETVGGYVETYSYDEASQMRSRESYKVDNRNIHVVPVVMYKYNERGLITEIESHEMRGPSKPSKILQEWDNEGRMTKRTSSDGGIVFSYSYPGSGLNRDKYTSVVEMKGGSKISEISIAYDRRGRMTQKVTQRFDMGSATSKTTQDWQYDRQGQLLWTWVDGGREESRFYEGGRLHSAITSDKALTLKNILEIYCLDYTAAGQLSQWSVSFLQDKEKWTTTRTFDNLERLKTQTVKLFNNDTIASLQCDYDINGRLTKQTIQGLGAETTDYTYDKNRLLTAHDNSAMVDATGPYKFDTMGNMIKNGNLNFEYADDFSWIKARLDGGNDKMLWSFDEFGRIIEKQEIGRGSTKFAYDGFGKTSSITDFHGQTKEISYDAAGNKMLEKTSKSSTLYVNDELHLSQWEGDASQGGPVHQTRYFSSIGSLPIVSWGVTYVPNASPALRCSCNVLNHKGSVYITLCEDAKLDSILDTNAWGYMPNSNLIHPTDEKHWDETGQTFEANTYNTQASIIDFKSRYYDPYLCRYLSPDTLDILPSIFVSDGMNRYVFNLNDPVNLIDPTGHFSANGWIAEAVGIAGVVGGLFLTFAVSAALGPEASLFWVVLVGATGAGLTSAGVASIRFGLNHSESENFWKGYRWTVGTAFAFGFVTGGFGSFMNDARVSFRVMQAARIFTNTYSVGSDAKKAHDLFFLMTVGGRIAIDTAAGVGQGVLDNLIEREIYHKDISLTSGLLLTAGISAGISTVGGGAGYAWRNRGGAAVLKRFWRTKGGTRFGKAPKPFPRDKNLQPEVRNVEWPMNDKWDRFDWENWGSSYVALDYAKWLVDDDVAGLSIRVLGIMNYGAT